MIGGELGKVFKKLTISGQVTGTTLDKGKYKIRMVLPSHGSCLLAHPGSPVLHGSLGP